MAQAAYSLGTFTNAPVLKGGTAPTISANFTLFIESQPALKVGDTLPGGDAIVLGEFTVFVNGLPMARVLDSTALGGTILTGATTVFVGK